MMPVSGVNAGFAQPLAAAEKASGAPRAHSPEEVRDRPLKPVTDRYIPEEKQEPSGRYWMGRDEDGRPKICFDGPPRAEDAPKGPEGASGAEGTGQNKGAGGPEKKGGKKGKRCVGDTGKADREIEKLKKEKEELERRINTEHDEARIKELERRLAQVDRELREKDNDAYRKRHSTFKELP